MSRIVVKVGSNVLTRSDGHPHVTNISALVDQIALLRSQGHELVLVSSGAVACGRGEVTPAVTLDTVAERQLYSSIGQIKLINLYSRLFGAYGITIGQVLTQKDNFSSREAYLNQRACIMTMIACGVVPVINENDTVSLTELMFTDNDELSGMVATMIDADTLVILSNVDGIYTGAPSDSSSALISRVHPGEDPSAHIVAAKSGFGRGGMTTKCSIARKLADEGVAVIIANGMRQNILVNVINDPAAVPHTMFEPVERPLSTLKRWIAHSDSFTKGRIAVDAAAADAIAGPRAVSLLPVGVTAVDGQWEAGDIVSITDVTGHRIALGRASMSDTRLRACLGKHDQPPVVHYDYMYVE